MPAKDPKVPYEAAAAQAVGDVQGTAPASEVPQETVAGDRLPYEAEMDRMMAEFKAMSARVAAMETELSTARAGLAAATAALGPPPVATYGKAIYDKLVSHRNANPDLGAHFDRIIEQTRDLANASAGLLAGEGDKATVVELAGPAVAAVDRFITRTHPRVTSKAVDFSALAADLEYLQDAAAA